MSEDITITFTGIDEVSSVIQEIIDKMKSIPSPESGNNGETKITITSDQVEPELEVFMWEMLDLFKERAEADEAKFLLNL